MDFGLRGKTALVLAGGGGLGRAIAKSLAGEGVNVAVAGRGADSIAGTQAALAKIGGKSMGLVWDLADLAQIDGNVAKIEKELGPVDILVNNTGGPPPTTANGQPAFAVYESCDAGWAAHSIHVLALDDDKIATLTLFAPPTGPQLFEAFGLPPILPS